MGVAVPSAKSWNPELTSSRMSHVPASSVDPTGTSTPVTAKIAVDSLTHSSRETVTPSRIAPSELANVVSVPSESRYPMK